MQPTVFSPRVAWKQVGAVFGLTFCIFGMMELSASDNQITPFSVFRVILVGFFAAGVFAALVGDLRKTEGKR